VSIREKLEAQIARNTPEGASAANRTKAVLSLFIRNNFMRKPKIDEQSLPVCDWNLANEWIYAGDASSIVINGMVTPLRYGDKLPTVEIANAVRDAGLKVIPINAASIRFPLGEFVPDVPVRKKRAVELS
jgi:hypothetical protein